MFVQTWIDLLAINNLVLFCFTGICHNLYSCWEYEKKLLLKNHYSMYFDTHLVDER